MPDEEKDGETPAPLPGESVHAFLQRIRRTSRPEGGVRFIEMNGELGPISMGFGGPVEPPKDDPED